MKDVYEKIEAGEFPAGMKVMFVDDDEQSLNLHGNMLTQLTYDVTTCSQATEALKLLREKKGSFDLIFVAVSIPDMDYCTLLKCIKEEMNLPCIAMLDDDGENISSIMQGIAHGACDFLIKPMDKEQVKNIWHHVAKKKYTEKLELEGGGVKNKENCSLSNLAAEDIAKNMSGSEDDSTNVSTTKKPRFVWTEERKQKFENAIKQIGFGNVVPKKILEVMNDAEMTREIVASHLQKYRLKSGGNDACHRQIEPDVRMSSSRMPPIPNQSPGQPKFQSSQLPIQRFSSQFPQGQTKIFDHFTILQTNNWVNHQSNESIVGPSDTMMNMPSNSTQPLADFHTQYSHAYTNAHHRIPTTSYANNCHLHPRYHGDCMPTASADVNYTHLPTRQPASGSQGVNVNNIGFLERHEDTLRFLNPNGNDGQQLENSPIIETTTFIQQPHRSNLGRGYHESPTGLGFGGAEISNPFGVQSSEHKC